MDFGDVFEMLAFERDETSGWPSRPQMHLTFSPIAMCVFARFGIHLLDDMICFFWGYGPIQSHDRHPRHHKARASERASSSPCRLARRAASPQLSSRSGTSG